MANQLITMSKVVLFLQLIFLIEHSAAKGKPGILTGELMDVSHCNNFRGNSFYIHPNFTQFHQDGGGLTSFSINFRVSRPSKIISKIVLNMDYCTQGVGRNCEHFQTWTFGRESCGIWTSRLMLWSKFYEAIHPRWSCPFNVGEYAMTNATLDVGVLENSPFQVENKEWNVTANIYDDNAQRWICFNIIYKISRARRRTSAKA